MASYARVELEDDDPENEGIERPAETLASSPEVISENGEGEHSAAVAQDQECNPKEAGEETIEDTEKTAVEMGVEKVEEENGGDGRIDMEGGVSEGGGGEGGDGAGADAINPEVQTRSSKWSCASLYAFMMTNAAMLYISQALSAWGDRMWTFAVSLYLVEIQEQSLRLTAIYGLCISGSSLIFGAAIGKWVDKTPRLKAARSALIIQNSCVIINAGILVSVLLLKYEILPIWNGGLYVLCQFLIILLGTLSNLASLAEKICIQKDWIVVVAGGDKEVLANMNAIMRRVDLVSNILAPIAVSAILTSSMLVGGIFIACWNACSMVIEYWNLWRVYKHVPALAFKGGVEVTGKSKKEGDGKGKHTELPESDSMEIGELALGAENHSPSETKDEDNKTGCNKLADSDNIEMENHSPSKIKSEDNKSGYTQLPDSDTLETENETPVKSANGDNRNGYMELPGHDPVEVGDEPLSKDAQVDNKTGYAKLAGSDVVANENNSCARSLNEAEHGSVGFTEVPITPLPPTSLSPLPPSSPSPAPEEKTGCCGGCCNQLKSKFHDMFEGWKIYISYTEFWAGLGLAFLYMTVLGFDSITIGIGYSQGVPEYIIGVLQALGSITGILGTVLYPFMRKRIGIERAGLYSLGIEITFLTLCLGSVWAPGSPFIYDYDREATTSLEVDWDLNSVTYAPADYYSSFAENATEGPNMPGPTCTYIGSEEQQTSFWSAGLLFTGIVLSRIGLWSYDLVVTQLIQENVDETERGAFNGVHRALECSFDMMHFILVIILPCPETFGYLIILSVVFVILGSMSYMVYSYKRRGHLVHVKLNPLKKCNGHTPV